MIFSTATVPVNPEGVAGLTQEQFWAGLLLKARDARQFLLPGMCTRCDVSLEGDGYLMREAVVLNDDITEFVTFAPHHKVSFHQVKSPL